MLKGNFIAAAFAVAILIPGHAVAEDEYNVSSGLTADNAPLALHGVDTVAFVKTGNRIEGAANYTAVHDGVAYYFSTRDNLRTFKSSPERYTPQYGGFCAFGVSVNKKFDGDPRWADVRDGKLYVFLSESVFEAYQKNPEAALAKAEANWANIRSTAAREL
jgi:YHS domain-containing protein